MKQGEIQLLILDVDGVLTDGGLTMNSTGEWSKTFHVHDGYAIQLWKKSGGKVAILSARNDESVAKRARELGIEWVRMGEANKLAGYAEIVTGAGLSDSAVAYVADDLPDLGPLSRCGFPVAVANAAATVKRAAQYVTRRPGGCGAIAEVVELLLRQQGKWSPLRERD